MRKLCHILLLIMCLTLLFCSCNAEKEPTDTMDTVDELTTVLGLPSTGVGRVEPPAPPVIPLDYTICIDPGHGFTDGGCGENIFPDGILEKDITLTIAKLVDEKLRGLGFTTVLLHDGVNVPTGGDSNNNSIFSATERAIYANKLDIDYYVSIHVNAFDNPDVRGVQIYYEQNYLKNNEWSALIAQSINDAISEGVDIASISIKTQADHSLAVTRETRAAASLIEIGFCTNEIDRTNMLNADWQNSMADAIAGGIYKFFTELNNPAPITE